MVQPIIVIINQYFIRRFELCNQFAQELLENYRTYQCICSKNQIWYIFRKHRWIKHSDKLFPQNIFDKLIAECKELFRYVSKQTMMTRFSRLNTQCVLNFCKKPHLNI